jgi:prepilin-type N-terminal cleavage/methylation domain-containing protein
MKAGFSFLEVLIAITIFTVGLFMNAQVFSPAINGIVKAHLRVRALNLAQEVMEREVIDKKFSDLEPPVGVEGTPYSATQDGFVVNVKTRHVEDQIDNLNNVAAAATDFIRVDVIVKEQNDRIRPVKLRTLKTDLTT